MRQRVFRLLVFDVLGGHVIARRQVQLPSVHSCRVFLEGALCRCAETCVTCNSCLFRRCHGVFQPKRQG